MCGFEKHPFYSIPTTYCIQRVMWLFVVFVLLWARSQFYQALSCVSVTDSASISDGQGRTLTCCGRHISEARHEDSINSQSAHSTASHTAPLTQNVLTLISPDTRGTGWTTGWFLLYLSGSVDKVTLWLVAYNTCFKPSYCYQLCYVWTLRILRAESVVALFYPHSHA